MLRMTLCLMLAIASIKYMAILRVDEDGILRAFNETTEFETEVFIQCNCNDLKGIEMKGVEKLKNVKKLIIQKCTDLESLSEVTNLFRESLISLNIKEPLTKAPRGWKGFVNRSSSQADSNFILNFINLEELDLVNNRLTTIPVYVKELANYKLEEVFLNGNPITKLPDWFSNLPIRLLVYIDTSKFDQRDREHLRIRKILRDASSNIEQLVDCSYSVLRSNNSTPQVKIEEDSDAFFSCLIRARDLSMQPSSIKECIDDVVEIICGCFKNSKDKSACAKDVIGYFYRKCLDEVYDSENLLLE